MTSDNSPAPAGKVICFYSFKGGTGRTMALANVAWILASRGKRVLVVDWDLDAPGLHRFFHPFLDQVVLDASEGVVDLLVDYARAAIPQRERSDDWHLPFARIEPHALTLDWDFPDEGRLDLIPAGRPGRSYSTTLAGFSWDDFYHRLGGGLLLSAMRDDMRLNYDYTLIDSRTGLSDIASICTVRFPDTVVDCFTMSTQSIEGAAAVARAIDELRERDIRILPVPMRVEDGELSKLETGRALARSRFSGYPRDLTDEDDRQRYWGDVEVPYRVFYAYEETLATFADEPRQSASLLAAYERLTSRITDGEVTELAPLPEAERQKVAEQFVRARPRITPDVFVSFAPEDRTWANWVHKVLTHAGVSVVLQSVSYPPGVDVEAEIARQVSETHHTVVVLSNSYVKFQRAEAVWQAMADGELTRNRASLIPIRVTEGKLRPPFDAWNSVSLSGLDGVTAAEIVLRSLDLPLPADGSSPDPVSGARYPGNPPPVWNVPTRNPVFTGRAALLEQIWENLSQGMAALVPQALHGLGGVGKTQLAVEFAHRFRADYDLVWWVSSEQEEFITSALADLAPHLGVRRGENTEEAAEAVREALRLGLPYKRWLLIFDNAEDPERLARHLPFGSGHVLITSRNPTWAHLAAPIEVDAFAREESIEHLTSRVDGLDAGAADAVARLLGDLPLAVELAGAWLESTGMPVEEYLQLLGTQLARWLEESQPEGYPLPAAVTWRISMQRLGEQSPAAVRLLQLCSCFSADPIAMRLLYSDETVRLLLPFDRSLREKMQLGQVIRDLGRYALAKVDMDQGRSSIQVHRLVQAVVRESMTPEEFDATQHEVHRILYDARPSQGATDDPENWVKYREIWPHLIPSGADNCDEEPTRALIVERVRYLWLRGEFEDAMTLARRQEAKWTELRGPDDRQLLYLRFHIGNVLRSQGDYSGALEVTQDVLRRQTELDGPDYVHTLLTSTALGADLGATGNYDESLHVARDAYERFVNLYGERDSLSLSAATNLSLSLRLIGDCFQARDLDSRTLELRRQVLGDDHPLTLGSAANLARDLREAGNFRDSARLLRNTVERYREVVGEDFPETLRTATSLAASMRKQGQHEEALELNRQTLEQYRVSYRPDYPDALACRLNLACDLSALGRSSEALALADETMSAYLDTRGPDHQYTLVSANNRAIYLRAVGRTEEGLEVAQATLEALTRVYGDQHPHRLACAINVANALADVGRVVEAESLERATYRGFEARLGPEHPDTLFSSGNLAITLRSQGRAEEATAIMARSLEMLERVLGPDHPHIAWGRRWRRISRDLEPQPV